MSRQCLCNLPSRHIYKPFSLTLIPITPLPPLPHYPSLGCPIGSRSNRSHAQSGWLNACCCHAQSGCVTFILSYCPIGFWVMIIDILVPWSNTTFLTRVPNRVSIQPFPRPIGLAERVLLPCPIGLRDVHPLQMPNRVLGYDHNILIPWSTLLCSLGCQLAS